jgi:hypothetical protein
MTVHRSRRHKPVCDIHPVTGACIEMFYADRNAGFGKERRGLVLVASSARFRTQWSDARTIPSPHSVSGFTVAHSTHSGPFSTVATFGPLRNCKVRQPSSWKAMSRHLRH